MRWEQLFADLEAQYRGELMRDQGVEVQEMVRIERSQTTLASRLLSWKGQPVEVSVLGGLRCAGTLSSVGSGWVMVSAGALEYLVLMEAVRGFVGGGSRVAPPVEAKPLRISLLMALRVLARDRAPVTVYSRDGAVAVTGTIESVGQDFIQVAAHAVGEYVSASRVVARHLLPLEAMAVLQRIA